jgi:hypothetical protein
VATLSLAILPDQTPQATLHLPACDIELPQLPPCIYLPANVIVPPYDLFLVFENDHLLTRRALDGSVIVANYRASDDGGMPSFIGVFGDAVGAACADLEEELYGQLQAVPPEPVVVPSLSRELPELDLSLMRQLITPIRSWRCASLSCQQVSVVRPKAGRR